MTVAMLLANTVAAARQPWTWPAAGRRRPSSPAGWSRRGRPTPASSAGPRRLRGLVDPVNMTNNATARVGMTPLTAAILAAGEGIDPVLQPPTGTNRLALTADLLGAHAFSIRGVLCLSGDPMEVSATGAGRLRPRRRRPRRLATDLGQGRASARRIDPPGRFLVGMAEAPGADPSAAPAWPPRPTPAPPSSDPPVYDVTQFAAWLDRLAGRGLPDRVAILAGILPPTSAAQLERFATLPGSSVPAAVLARMRAARDQRGEGIALAAEMVQAVPPTSPAAPRRHPHHRPRPRLPHPRVVEEAAAFLHRPVPS